MEHVLTLQDIMMESFVLLPARWTTDRARTVLRNRAFTHVILHQMLSDGLTSFYLIDVAEVQNSLSVLDDEVLLQDAFNLHDCKPTPTADPNKDADAFRPCVVVISEGRVIGFVDESALIPEDGSLLTERDGIVDSSSVDFATREVSHSFSAYPALETIPSAVIPGDDFSVIVGLRETPDETLFAMQPIDIASATPEERLLIILRASGATVLGDSFATLLLEQSASHVFKCKAGRDAAEIVLTAQFFFKEEIVGVARRSITTANQPEETGGIGATEPNPYPIAPTALKSKVDLTIDLTESDGVLEWWFLASEPKLREGPFRIKISDTRKFAAEVDAALRPRNYRGRFAYNSLVNFGQQIADKMPPVFFDILRNVHQAIGRLPRVLLLTNEPFVPWELALLRKPLLDADAPPFLAAQTLMGRWWIDDAIPYPPPDEQLVKVFTAVASKYGLGSNQRELKQAMQEQKTLHLEHNATKLEATLDDLGTVVFGARMPGHLIHFAVHGYSNPEANMQALILADGQILSPGELVGSYSFEEVPRFSVIFFNACQVATAGTRLGQAAGFPGALLRGGARGFIAPLWEVHDDSARDFAEHFYKATLKDHQTVSEALRANRIRYGKDESTTPMAYIYYGHPALNLTVSSEEDSHA